MAIYFRILKLNKRTLVLFALFCLLCHSGVQAQVTYNKRAGGPIGEGPKVGDFNSPAGLDNVEFSTGTVNVNIPLYEIKVHDIRVPVSISYSALGIKVGQEAGPAGMGWELNAGGKINLQVNGLEDNANTSNSIRSTSDFILNPDNNINDRNKLREVVLGNYDHAHDVFSYTLPTSGGKFTRNGLTFPYDPTFKYDYQTNRIVTCDGLKYDFSLGDKIIVYKRKFYQQKYDGSMNMEPVPFYAQWVKDMKTYGSDHNLSQIISSKFKDTVKFDYETISSAYYTFGIPAKTRMTTTETMSLNRKVAKKADGTWTDPDGQFYFYGEPVIGQTKIETVDHRRIKNITYATGKVVFSYSVNDVLGRDVLTTVTIYQKVAGADKLLKRYAFNYDGDVRYGHYLDHIEVLAAGGARAGKWKFSYYGTTVPFEMGKLPVVPNSESKAQDRWGFYNGHTENVTLLEQADSLISLRDIPHLVACYPNYPGSPASIFGYKRGENVAFYSPNNQNIKQQPFAKREFNFSQAIKGTLQSVTTPTGESVNYEYEPHKYQVEGWGGSYPYQRYNRIYEGGGIRVKSILRRDGIMFSGQTLSKKIYTYGVGGPAYTSTTESGYGIVNVPGVIMSVVYKYADGTSTHSVENLQYLSHPVNDLTLYKGSYAYYPSVTESIMNGARTSGQTVYYYSAEGVETGPWNRTVAGSLTQLNMPEFYTNQGIKKDLSAGVPGRVIEYAGTRTGGMKVRETANAMTDFPAPATSPKLYSYFGGVRGMLIGQYSGTFYMCVPVVVIGKRTSWECGNIATIPDMDPTGYKDFGPESNDNYYPGKYYGSTVELSALSNVFKLTGTTTTSYDLAGINPTVNSTYYYYDNILHMQPTRIVSLNSNGDSTMQRIRYAQDFLANTVDGVSLLRGANRVSEQVEGLSMVKKAGAYQITAGIKNTFRASYNQVVNDKTYRFNTFGKPVPLANYSETDSRYELESSYDVYDEMGNLALFSNVNSPKTAVFWGYNQQYPVAKIVNAPSTYDIGYTNFEMENIPAIDGKGYWKGYWLFSGTPVIDLTSPSADHVYPLTGKPVTKTYYTAGKKYILAYWYKSGSAVTVSGGTIGAETIKNTKGNWVFAEREITVSGTLTISGTGFIDELRFYPADAQMSSYTYNRGVGISGSLDAKGQSGAYEYDNEQRLRYIRDQQGNIVKAYDYNIGNRYKQ